MGEIAVNAADAQAPSSTADKPALTGELDSEISQLLKSLSKKDAITKIKALQVNARYCFHGVQYQSLTSDTLALC